MDIREIDFLSLNKLRFWLFLVLEIFVVFWGHIVCNMIDVFSIIDVFFKVQFWINSITNRCNRKDWFCGYITDLQGILYKISEYVI